MQFIKEIEELYRAHSDGLYRYILFLCGDRSCAEDILQNTFLRVLRHFSGFRGESAVKTWIYAIARNETMRYMKRRPPEADLEERRAAAGSAEEAAILGEEARTVMEALSRLDAERQSLMLLRLFDGLPFSEIGRLLGRSEVWARVTYLRERKKLQK